MSEHSITVNSGSSVRLKTAGKYCDRDIIVTATGSGGGARISYCQFTGDQIIETGIVCNQDTRIRIVYTRESSSAMYLYGVVNTGNTASVTAYLSSGGAWRFGNRSQSKNIPINTELVHTAIVDKSGITNADGTTAYSTVSDFETIGSLVVGTCRAASGNIQSAQYVGKIYLMEMWQGDELVRKLVPAALPDGSAAFFDEVSQEYFHSITDYPLIGGT